jgi:HAD superfamily hydrolase (TIGR01490 family)
MRTSGAHTLHPAAQQFIESVLRLKPKVAAFDCDGTLWSGDAGEAFFDWGITNGVVSEEIGRRMRARYADYRAGKVSEEEMCGEMVTMHTGIPEAAMVQAADDFMDRIFSGEIFPEMLELIRRLRDQGCEVWVVSASNEWVIRAGMKQFGVGEDRILASTVESENGVVTDRLVRVPSGAGKTRALREVAKKEIDAAFGNSRFDTEMLAMAKHPFAINPNADLDATARGRGWPIYFPGGAR